MLVVADMNRVWGRPILTLHLSGIRVEQGCFERRTRRFSSGSLFDLNHEALVFVGFHGMFLSLASPQQIESFQIVVNVRNIACSKFGL